jgi:hypothetical protein
VAPGREDVSLKIDVQDETRATVTPWPFDVDRLDIPFQGRLVSNRPYAGQDDFLPDFYKAPRVNITYTLSRA